MGTHANTQGQTLTEAVQAALYELIQAGSTGTGCRAGALQGPSDVLRTGTCIPPPLDQLGFPERQRARESQTQTGIISSLEISRAECGEVVQVQHLRKRSSPHLISCATALQLSKPSRTGGTTANKYIVF